jgi:phytoene synthase
MRMSSPETALATPADMAACRELLRDGSRSFLAASHLLPARVADPAIALYAFCRLADDAIDAGRCSEAALASLRLRLDRIYLRRPMAYAADRALCDTVWRFGLPRPLLDGLIEGFVWDAEGRRYETFDDLCAYAARVAGTVGAMMAVLMGQRAPHVVARACELGIAMQLTNIARDVGEDARNGRLYLPRRWLAEAGVDAEALLRSPIHTPALATVVRRLLSEAEGLYESAGAGIAALPADCRAGIRAARLLYAEIGEEVARRGFDSVSGRARVGGGRKLGLMVRAVAGVFPASSVSPAWPSCEAARFLVEAVVSVKHVREPGPLAAPSRAPVGGFVGLLTLFERLERADRLQNASR